MPYFLSVNLGKRSKLGLGWFVLSYPFEIANPQPHKLYFRLPGHLHKLQCPFRFTKDQIRDSTLTIRSGDDEKTMIDSVEAMLKYLGYKVTARTSSIEALEVFRAQPDEFDLVITDQTMPNMRGDELAQKLISITPDIVWALFIPTKTISVIPFNSFQV